MAKNPTYHSKMKHIVVQYHFVRDMVEDKMMLLVKVDALKNVADSLTKFVSTNKFPPRPPTICKKKKWENIGNVLYSLHGYLHVLFFNLFFICFFDPL
jgi:hypothetical protein